MTAKFGPAGNSDSFRAMGYRKTDQVPEYIRRMGLDAYEYQCGRGVRISLEAAQQLGQLAAQQGVTLSLLAPYYISLSGIEEQKRLASIDYILQSARQPLQWERSGWWYTPAPVPRFPVSRLCSWQQIPCKERSGRWTRRAWVTSTCARKRWASSTSWATWKRC